MNYLIELNCELTNNLLKDIYDSYRIRTQYAMNNFIILRAVNEILNNIDDINNISSDLLDILDSSLVASDNFSDDWTTKTNIRTLWSDVKLGTFISKVSYNVLVDLVASLDEIMVKITELYLPNMDLAQLKKKKFCTNVSSRNIIIDSKTLIYPYVVYRHCLRNDNEIPLLFSDPQVIPWIYMTIKLRHMIIHNNAKFDPNEDNNFYREKLKETHVDGSLRFDKNQIDAIFTYHASHLANFICWLDSKAEIYSGTDFKPKNEPKQFRKFIYE